MIFFWVRAVMITEIVPLLLSSAMIRFPGSNDFQLIQVPQIACMSSVLCLCIAFPVALWLRGFLLSRGFIAFTSNDSHIQLHDEMVLFYHWTHSSVVVSNKLPPFLLLPRLVLSCIKVL